MPLTLVSKDRATRKNGSPIALYIWIGLVLAVGVVAVWFGWRGGAGIPTPGPGTHLSPTVATLDSAILVFREGLECILVLAAITASFRGKNSSYRKPVAVGGVVGFAATVGTWFLAIWLIGTFGGTGLSVQAATGIPAIIVLLVVMNWFFHKVYWGGWISHHNKRRKNVVNAAKGTAARNAFLGLAGLGLASVYREGFEVVIFLQGLREGYGSGVVLKGAALGLLFTLALGVLTFSVHARLPYKKMLVLTGALLVIVLWIMVGEEIHEMQLAGWIGTTAIPGLHIPGWLGTWLSVFPNYETFFGQVVALVVVVGSYVGAQYLRVWRPRRHGEVAATMSDAPPTVPAHQAGRAPQPVTAGQDNQ